MSNPSPSQVSVQLRKTLRAQVAVELDAALANQAPVEDVAHRLRPTLARLAELEHRAALRTRRTLRRWIGALGALLMAALLGMLGLAASGVPG